MIKLIQFHPKRLFEHMLFLNKNSPSKLMLGIKVQEEIFRVYYLFVNHN